MNIKRHNAPKIRGNKNQRVQALNKELEFVFAGNSKMTDELYEELEGLTF
jgi:hypothetical protein